MIKRKLCLALSIINLFGINSYASSLQELFNDSNNKVVFENGIISCNNKSLDSDDYVSEINEQDSHTTFININDVPIDDNGVMEVLPNIEGSDNISLQNLGNTNQILKSITFYGDNTQYNGIFYLYPTIDDINFATAKSIIKKINIPSNNKNRKITISIPSDSCWYAYIDIPNNLSVKFMNDSHIIPNNNQNIRLAIQQDKEYKNIFSQYKITSEKYNKLKGINNTNKLFRLQKMVNVTINDDIQVDNVNKIDKKSYKPLTLVKVKDGNSFKAVKRKSNCYHMTNNTLKKGIKMVIVLGCCMLVYKLLSHITNSNFFQNYIGANILNNNKNITLAGMKGNKQDLVIPADIFNAEKDNKNFAQSMFSWIYNGILKKYFIDLLGPLLV